jgi:hypothetical protein
LEPGVIAYKFLDPGGLAPFTGFRWRIDEWVDASSIEPCRSGVHALRPRDLPFWLAAELWEIELDGDVVTQGRKVVAQRGRLLRRREDWTPLLVNEFVGDCLARTRAKFGSVPGLSTFVFDIERFRAQGRFPLAAFAAAHAAELSGGPQAYERERLRQAAWLAERLGLGAV